MTITGPYPNKRQRRGKDSTRYSRPTVKKQKNAKKIIDDLNQGILNLTTGDDAAYTRLKTMKIKEKLFLKR
mgnify:CR=1 FL=1